MTIKEIFGSIRRAFQLFPTPIAEQSFRQRLMRAILFWGMSGFLFDAWTYGVFSGPMEWVVILILLVFPFLIGSVVFATMEHFFYFYRAKRN